MVIHDQPFVPQLRRRRAVPPGDVVAYSCAVHPREVEVARLDGGRAVDPNGDLAQGELTRREAFHDAGPEGLYL